MADLPRRREEALYAKTLNELRSLSKDQLVQQHDSLIDTGGYLADLDYYLREITRREGEERTKTMVRLTWAIFALTAVNVAAVVIDLICR